MRKIIVSLLLLVFVLIANTQTTQHGILLTWTQGTCPAGTTCTITKNTVYSAPVSTGPFTAIFTSTSPITSYLDPLTTSNQGKQACYAVTSWTTIESPMSSPPVCNTFPVQSGAPQGLATSQQ